MINIHLAETVPKPRVESPNNQRRINKNTTIQCKLKQNYKLSSTPKMERHPSARNLLEKHMKEKENPFYLLNIKVCSQPDTTQPMNYQVNINQIEEKVYSKNDIFWVKNNEELKREEMKETETAKHTNSLTEYQCNLDKIITEAIQNNRNYDVIEKAFKGCLRTEKKK